MSTNNAEQSGITPAQLIDLEARARAASPQDFDSAQIKRVGGWGECPTCGGDGSVTIGNDYCNYDMAAQGVQFYGVGDAHVKAEAFYRAANPATVLALIALARRSASLTPVAPADLHQPSWQNGYQHGYSTGLGDGRADLTNPNATSPAERAAAPAHSMANDPTFQALCEPLLNGEIPSAPHVAALEAYVDGIINGLRLLLEQCVAAQACTTCDGSGTVHRADGSYAGECPCEGDAGEPPAAITKITDTAARTLIDFIYERVGFSDRDTLIGEVQRIVIGCMNASYSAGVRDRMSASIHPLRTKDDHAAALAEVESLMNAAPGTPEGDRLAVLATLIEAYEREHFPMPDNGELVQLRAQNMLLLGLYDAVAKLVKAKGRYHTQLNYDQVVAAYDAVRTADTEEAAPAPAIERRRPLQHAALPRDAECALEHAALALDKAGDKEAHDHVTTVLREHLPPDPVE